MTTEASNADRVIALIAEQAKKDFPDATDLGPVVRESLQRAVTSADLATASTLERGDLIKFTIEVQRGDEVRTRSFRTRPSAAGLLTMLSKSAQDGDTIVTTTVFQGGKATVRDSWPLDLETAEALLPDFRVDEVFEPSPAKNSLAMKNLGRLGKVGLRTSVGPPKWRKPRVSASFGRTETGTRALSVQAGWRFRCYSAHWVAPK